MKIQNTILAYRHFSALAIIMRNDADESNVNEWSGMGLYIELLKIEARMHRIAVMQCNGEGNADRLEKQWEKGVEQVKALILPEYHRYLHFNGDPRGYTLKMEVNRVEKDEAMLCNRLNGMYQDFGGYYILTPDF